MFKSLQIYLVFLLVLPACSVQKQADDMIDTSHSIHTDTKNVADGMAATKRGLSMSESFKFTKDVINEMYGVDEIPGSAGAMSNYERSLVGDAGAYIRGLYFQYWDAGYNEDTDELDNRLALSLEWLITQTNQYIPAGFRVDGFFNTYFPDRSYKATASLAAELDAVLPGFENALRLAKLKNFNLYTLIVASLRQCNNKDPAFNFPKARTKICDFKPKFVYLLQLRHNYLPMLMFSETTDFGDSNIISRGLKTRGSSTDLDASSITEDSLLLWAGWLKAAQQTRADLRSLCVQPQYNTTFSDLVGNLTLGPGFVPAANSPFVATPFGRAQTAFSQALASVKNQAQLQSFGAHCAQ